MAGAPSAARDYDAREAVKTLYLLLEALPSHMPVYCYGTSENREALLKCEAEEEAAALNQVDVKTAVQALALEMWGNPDSEPDMHEDWSIPRVRALIKNLARAAGVTVPPWA